MYEASVDPYCYPGTTILKNVPGLRNQAALEKFEAAMTAQRSDEPLPTGRFTVKHYRAIHHHLFQDVYPWAGKFRTVRLAKGGSAFCYPEHIAREMKALFAGLKAKNRLRDLPPNGFVREAASFLATLNAIHPFREGNGRSQLSFVALLADDAGQPLNLAMLHTDEFLEAMVASFGGEEAPLRQALGSMIGVR
jgi:cell filamentation protein